MEDGQTQTDRQTDRQTKTERGGKTETQKVRQTHEQGWMDQ